MLKYFLSLIIGISLVNVAFSQKGDTTIFYYSYQGGIIVRVPTLAQADYFRVILPPDSGDSRHNVKEFYKNGKIKLVSKLMKGYNVFNPKSDLMFFDGDFISYYPSGKKYSIAHYINGDMDGLEYRFYPNGRVYCTLKHRVSSKEVLYWECYDTLGNQICHDGSGRFIDRTENYAYPDIVSDGPVVKGYFDGEWQGNLEKRFNLKYKAQFKNGKVISATGYDSQGNTYPFTKYIERAQYRTGEVEFVEVLREYVKLPKNYNGGKMQINAMHLWFVVEKDGHISNLRIPETTDTVLQKSVFAGVAKCDHWSPTKIFGVPVRTEIVIPLETTSDSRVSVISAPHSIEYKERLLADDEMAGK